MTVRNIRKTRDAWLKEATDELRPYFQAVGYQVPEEIRFAIGFTSHGGRSSRVGEHWQPTASDDGHHEIFIRPDQSDPIEVLGILVHELVHAAVPPGSKHGPVFRKAALAVGLTGKMRSTGSSDVLVERLVKVVDRIGHLPHGKLNLRERGSDTPPKQSTRLLKVECDCGYTVRMARKWIDAKGTPLCPEHGSMKCEPA